MTNLNINKGYFISFAILVGLAIIIVILKPGIKDYKYSSEETLAQTVKRNQMISVNRYKKLLISGGDPVILVDLRSPDEYESGHLPEAVNIPQGTILDKESLKIFKTNGATKVIYSDSSFKAAETWIVLYQMGCPGLAILETTGSLDHLIANWSDIDDPLIYKDERKQFTFVRDTSVTVIPN